MAANDAIELKVAAMRRALEHARDAIPQVTRIDAELGRRLRSRFALLADAADSSLESLDPSNREDGHKRLRQGQDLIAETLGFLAAASARRINLDDGMTSLAQDWLDTLSDTAGLPQIAVVIPAPTEFTGMVTQVVRLRLPVDGVWGLPVAIHEYGHFVASQMARRADRDGIERTVIPVEDLLHSTASKEDLPLLYWHGHEVFSDAFAAATAGPAYTHYCIRYRFDPLTAHEVTATHPSAARRVRVQLTVLGALARNDRGGFLAGEVAGLRKRWLTGLEASGVDPGEAPDPALDQLENDLIQLLLADEALSRIRYRDHAAARALAEQPLDQQRQPPSVAHALNAAWCRRQAIEKDETDAHVIARRVDAVAEATKQFVGQVIDHG
jgi:hypothetical protein